MPTACFKVGGFDEIMMNLTNLFHRSPKPPLPTPIHKLSAKDLEFGFKDNGGINYYRINTQLGIGLEHYGKAMEFTMWMAAGLQPTELHHLLDIQAEVIEQLVEGKKGKLEILMWVNREIRLRSEMVIHTELLYNFIACHYIREDESMSEWVESIHNEKVIAFKECVKTRTAYEFFQLPELRNTTAITSMSPEEWNTHWSGSIREQEKLQKQIDYLRSELKSAPVRKTTKRAS